MVSAWYALTMPEIDRETALQVMRQMAQKGGLAKSARKTAAAKRNIAKRWADKVANDATVANKSATELASLPSA